jgi:DNA-directed RNA polymerase subunit L
MSEKIDIKIKELGRKRNKKLESSSVTLQFIGKDVSNVLVNAFRRVALNNIPVYAYTKSLMIIEENTSIFNNDYMKLRLEQIPIFNVSSPIYTLGENLITLDNIKFELESGDRVKYNDEVVYNAYINKTNETNENINVTTNDLKLYENTEEVNNNYDKEYPLLLIQLRPRESFKCKLESFLGNGTMNSIFSSICTAYYEENNEEQTDITLTMESTGQMSEYEVLIKSCKFMLDKFAKIENEINIKLEKLNEKTIIFTLENEDYTFGSLLVNILQSNRDIIFAGVAKTDLLVNSIRFNISSVSYNKLITSLKDGFNKIKNILNVILKECINKN